MPLHRLEQRSSRELLIDAALALALYHISSLVLGREMQVGDRLKAAKLVFYASYRCFREGIKAFNLTFQKYNHGPFTRELWETWGTLEWVGLLEVPSGPSTIRVTPEGRKVAESFISQVLSLPGNNRCLDYLIDTAISHAKKSTSQILDECYAMKVVPVGQKAEMTITEVPEDVVLTRRLTPSTMKSELQVPEQWLQQYDIDRKLNLVSGTPEGQLVRLHTPELIMEIEEALKELDRGEGRRMSRQELLQELQLGR